MRLIWFSGIGGLPGEDRISDIAAVDCAGVHSLASHLGNGATAHHPRIRQSQDTRTVFMSPAPK